MKMKLSKIALAVAALGASQAAFALTPAQVAAGPTTFVWLSGASAPTNSVFRSVLSLCNGIAGNGGANDAHMYLEETGTEPGRDSGNRMAYACTMRSAAGDRAGKKVGVYNTVEGGYFNAYAPHLSMAGENSPFLPGSLKRINDVAVLGGGGKCATGAPDGTTNVVIAGVPYPIPRYNNCTDTITKNFSAALKGDAAGVPGESYPDGGFSDTEYVINKLNLDITRDVSAIGSEVATNIGQAFGVGVSYPLYYQLQQNDVASGALAAACEQGSPTAPNLTPACQPGLPAQRYTAIANRDTVGAVDASLFGGPAGSVVNLARRVPTSGTQSASNIRFLHKPCATGVPGGVLEPARAADSTSTAILTEQSGTSGVKRELNTATGANQFALGVVSMENAPVPTATDDRWAFVKLDNVSPNVLPDDTPDPNHRANAMDGFYTFWYEVASFTAGGSASPASPSGAQLIAAATATLGNNDLRGIFATPVAGSSG
ncbi:MAG: hypothetical protein L0H15_05320, partial [Nitrosospira sp.]|nr:hypothetical protein [Nitrosospira sp.]